MNRNNLQISAVLLVLGISLVSACAVYAQTATGEVNGIVTDAQSAVVPEALVKLSNQATRIETTRSTNASGQFLFVNVQPGAYVLRVEKQGFKSAEIPAFDVGVNQAKTLNVRLDVGAVAETVEVRAESLLVESTTTELGSVIG